MDMEMTWFRRFGAHTSLKGLLLEQQRAGQVNVIDEGQAWHMCLSPDAATALRASSPETFSSPESDG
jgi:hypothetical protein